MESWTELYAICFMHATVFDPVWLNQKSTEKVQKKICKHIVETLQYLLTSLMVREEVTMKISVV